MDGQEENPRFCGGICEHARMTDGDGQAENERQMRSKLPSIGMTEMPAPNL